MYLHYMIYSIFIKNFINLISRTLGVEILRIVIFFFDLVFKNISIIKKLISYLRLYYKFDIKLLPEVFF